MATPDAPGGGGRDRGGYDPAAYWSQRLEADFSLRATGNHCYTEGYNRWLYRAKGRALRSALRGLVSGADVLDVGSGVGWGIEQLQRRGHHVEGCDIAEVAVERLRRRFPNVVFFVAALGEDPLPRRDGSYDAVTALDVTYHITDDDHWRSGLIELSRVLRPEGRLVVTDAFGVDDTGPQPHVRFRSASTWVGAAADAGLELEATRPYCRWLSRDREPSVLARLPDRVRGAAEYGLELMVPRRAHLRCSVFRQRGSRGGTGRLVR